MLIRSAETKDMDKIAALYVDNHRESYRGLLPEEYFEALTPAYAGEKWTGYALEPGSRLWVAYEGDRFLGFAAGTADKALPDAWLLDSLHVVRAARGKGIGTALVYTNGAHAARNGFRRMSVCIVRGNETARSLYTKLGAEHGCFFEDAFGCVISHSEKLIWEKLTAFQEGDSYDGSHNKTGR